MQADLQSQLLHKNGEIISRDVRKNTYGKVAATRNELRYVGKVRLALQAIDSRFVEFSESHGHLNNQNIEFGEGWMTSNFCILLVWVIFSSLNMNICELRKGCRTSELSAFPLELSEEAYGILNES